MSKERTSSPSVHPIANLAATLALFEPVFLVNENIESEKEWTGEYNPIDPSKPYPNFHQLLNTCYAAMGAMKEFIKEVDYLRNEHSRLTADAMQAMVACKGERLNPGSLAEGVETLIGQKHQCFDVMDKIYELSHDDDVQKLIEKFRHKRVEKTPIVNNNEIDGDGNILSFNPNLGILKPEPRTDESHQNGTPKPPETV